jgi:hypothetical protein
MASEDFEPEAEEIDRLVKELAKPLKSPSPAAPFAPLADALPPAEGGALTPGQRWTTARVIMPAPRTEPKQAFAFLSALALKLPKLPKISLPPMLTGMQPSALSARVFVGLGVLLSAAMPYWPYAHGWSWGLVSYLFAIAITVVTGIWGAKLTWDERLPAAHTVAVGIVLWGIGLLAAETVPRIVYV